MAGYTDREGLLNSICNKHCDCDYDGECPNCRLTEPIVAAPAADVAPVRHWRWIEDHDYLKCPECRVMVKCDFTFFDIGDWNYCPNCGAKMDG